MAKRGRLDLDDLKEFAANTIPVLAGMAVEVLGSGAVTWKGFLGGLATNILRMLASNKSKDEKPKCAPTDNGEN